MQSQKRQNDLFVSKANHSISVIQVYAPTSNAEETEVERFYEDLQDLLKLTPKKMVETTRRKKEPGQRLKPQQWLLDLL